MVGRAQGGGGAATMGHNGTSPLLVPWMCQDCQDGSTSKWLSGSDPTRAGGDGGNAIKREG